MCNFKVGGVYYYRSDCPGIIKITKIIEVSFYYQVYFDVISGDFSRNWFYSNGTIPERIVELTPELKAELL